MTAWRVRRADASDAGALALVGAATFLETFAGLLDGAGIVEHCARHHATAAYAAHLDDGRCAAWLAQAASGGAPIGYALVSATELPGSRLDADLELKRIYALSRFHGDGLGEALMRLAVDHAVAQGAQRLLLGAYAGNARALGFYRKHGFEQVATRVFDVGGRAYDDVVLAKWLGPA